VKINIASTYIYLDENELRQANLSTNQKIATAMDTYRAQGIDAGAAEILKIERNNPEVAGWAQCKSIILISVPRHSEVIEPMLDSPSSLLRSGFCIFAS
jgi:hypothetical protein